MPETGVPTVAEIEAIVSIEDRTFRNYRITQCYHELSAAISARLPGTANWCTFATWASQQAGQTIRGEDLDASIDDVLEEMARSGPLATVVAAIRAAGGTAAADDIRRVVREALGIEAVMARTATAVARGNMKVFEEIAPVFAAWCSERFADTTHDAEAIEAFVARLAPGEPPDGQEHLRTAIRSYHAALFADDDVARAQAVLYATVSVGLHEQTRLQPEIAEALDAAIEDPDVVVERLEKAFLPTPGWFGRLRKLAWRLLGRQTPLERAASGVVHLARARLRPIVTEHLMSINLAGTRLRLAADLTQEFPLNLRELRDSRLAGLLERVDPTPDSLRETGATDWADFKERMHFIADLFRAYQETPALLGPPFDEDGVRAIKAGRRP
jgi:hypothetical protein